MTFREWWDKEDMDSDAFADYTASEQVWKEARKDLKKDQRRREQKKKRARK